MASRKNRKSAKKSTRLGRAKTRATGNTHPGLLTARLVRDLMGAA